MSGQTIFENPVQVINSSNCCLKVPTHPPRPNEAFKNLLTREEVQNLAKLVASSPSAKLVDYCLRPYSEEKIGFLASHLCLVLEYDNFEKQSLFIKTVPFDAPTQAAYIEEKGCFRKESDFLRLLMPLMTEGWILDAWSPNCYLVKENTLVFEDMNSRGFANKSRFFDLPTMKSAAACIARFHAGSLLAEERIGW